MTNETRCANAGNIDTALTAIALLGGNVATIHDNTARSPHIPRVVTKRRSDLINRIGFKYGKLTVIAEGPRIARSSASGERKESAWISRCECGTVTRPIGICSLKKKKSCGCGNTVQKYSLIGRRFGQLLVIGQVASYRGKGERNVSKMWLCRCDCGNTKAIRSVSLIKGHTQSCGCWRQRNSYLGTPDESSFRALLCTYKMNARKRGFIFELSEEQFRALTKQSCFYCGVEPLHSIKRGQFAVNTLGRPYIYNGVDRKDNTRGYTTDNSVACCGVCNVMKKKLCAEEFIARCTRIAACHK